ncbi:hypothetical protein IMSAGC011_01947 [Lachnospiraceae bacterium]|nr:hypothetical protein IMSAGC011_01947 [Lachnospiraceae bacterium]
MTEFDREYYEKLIDGLEIQEILRSKLEFSGRIDAEYYQKNYLVYEEIIHKCKNNKLYHLADFLIGPFGSAYDTNNYTDIPNFRYVRGQDVKPFVLKDIEARYMTEEDFNKLSRYALKVDDILVSVVGTLGNACIVREKDIPAIFSCKSTVIRTNAVNPYFLTTYLNSKFGRNLLLRKERGVIQRGLNLDDLKMLDIPLFSNEFQNVCEKFINEAWKLMDASIDIYKEAEELLIETLGLKNFAPQAETYSVKTFKTSFEDAKRLDAEFYQKKYDDLFVILRQFNCKKLGEIVTIKKSIEPGSDSYSETGIPFVRVSDITKYGITQPKIKLPYHFIDNIQDLFPTKGTILLTKDGSVGIAYKVEEDTPFITSGALLHLHVLDDNEVNPDYLTLVLNSKAVQMQAERNAGGSIIQHWKPSEIEDVIIPILNKDIQNKISDKVRKSFRFRKESQILLGRAITIVEIAIEQGEEAALKLYE